MIAHAKSLLFSAGFPFRLIRFSLCRYRFGSLITSSSSHSSVVGIKMAVSETVLRVPLGSLSPSFHLASSFVNSTPILSFKPASRKRKGLKCTNSHEVSRVSKTLVKGNSFHSLPNCGLKGKKLVSTRCKCQKHDVEENMRSTLLPSDGFRSELKSDLDEMPLPVNGSLSSNGNAQSVGSSKSIEDEAWDLLRQSIVYYCGSPIGTIAANDPNSTSVLNYDQVFIRDFIPSGIAFLLKGEYDIVRNFILYTLQLQVIKTFLCFS